MFWAFRETIATVGIKISSVHPTTKKSFQNYFSTKFFSFDFNNFELQFMLIGWKLLLLVWQSPRDQVLRLVVIYSVFQGFSKAKTANGGSILSSSQFLILPQLPQKIKLASKVVKVDSKIIRSHYLRSKSLKLTVWSSGRHRGKSWEFSTLNHQPWPLGNYQSLPV